MTKKMTKTTTTMMTSNDKKDDDEWDYNSSNKDNDDNDNDNHPDMIPQDSTESEEEEGYCYYDDHQDGSDCDYGCYDDDDDCCGGGDSEDDDDDDDDEESWWKEMVEDGSWRQHALAVAIAIAATGLVHFFGLGNGSGISSSGSMMMTTSVQMRKKHRHLQSYQRTANVSFCNNNDWKHQQQQQQHYQADLLLPSPSSSLSSELRAMDFHLPIDLIPTMGTHYVADELQVDDYRELLLNHHHHHDDYENSGNDSNRNDDAILAEHAEYQCLVQSSSSGTESSSPPSYVKGMSYYYRQPDIDSMYSSSFKSKRQQEGGGGAPSILKQKKKSSSSSNNNSNKLQATKLTYTGFAAKFVNLSPDPVLLHWEGKGTGGEEEERRLVGEIGPMESLGTATTPGQAFSISPVYNDQDALARWVAVPDKAVMYYDPFMPSSSSSSLSEDDRYRKMRNRLSNEQLQLYKMQKVNEEFAKHYQIAARRPWLSNFPRAFPVHPIWDANYIGQQHAVVVADDDDKNNNNSSNEKEEEQSQRRRTFKLQVESVAPRVLTVRNFLSPEECRQLVQLALAEGMQASSLYAGGGTATTTEEGNNNNKNKNVRDRSTRSSTNTWLARDSAELIDQIYQRAASVLKIEASLLQGSAMDDSLHPHHHSTAESLQVIRYGTGEQYTAHHDFVYPSIRHRHQPTRFATLLFYLNDNFEGGQTVFPRAVNAQYHDGITIQPEQGKAVLFYNVLPDGNVDDLSQHSSQPVTKGEKVSFFLFLHYCVIVACRFFSFLFVGLVLMNFKYILLLLLFSPCLGKLGYSSPPTFGFGTHSSTRSQASILSN